METKIMSGGAFNYDQQRILNIIEIIENEIHAHYDGFVDEYGYSRDLSEDTVKAFQRGLNYLNLAYIYAHRIDYLLASDDGEKQFHERLQDDLDKYFHNVER